MHKLHHHIIWILTLACLPCASQDSLNFGIEAIKELHHSDHQILTDINQNSGYIVSPIYEDYISSWNLKEEHATQGKKISSGDIDFKNWVSERLNLTLSNNEELGTVSHCDLDSTSYYSSAKNGKSSVYSFNKRGERTLILESKGKTQYFHPFCTEDGSQLFFSSNLDNSSENFDLFYLNRLDEGWSSPIRLGPEINTGYSEVFPTWYNDTLYFSSNTNENLELYYSSRLDQYKNKTKLESPFNSDSDDFLLHKVNDQIFYLTSNRKNNKDQPYVLKKKIRTSKEKILISGYIACSGNRISNVSVLLTNRFGIQVDKDITDSDGNFLFRSDKSLEKYRLKLEKHDPRTEDCAVLYLTDKQGNVIQKILINDEGEFYFETIRADEISALNLVSAEDESLLQIELEGQIFENNPGDIGEGEPIRILDEDGNLMALAYTSSEGKFSFKDLSPESQYTFSFDSSRKQLQLIVQKGEDITMIPVVNNEAIFKRVSKENSVELIDDRGKLITIKKDEFFNLQNIFYEYASKDLTPIAKFQLDRLSQLIFNNNEVIIELTSHTDSRGESDYNLNLSKDRAQSAIEYLVARGVGTERMKGFGMGEKEPINHCIDGTTCSEEEHALNRRTEIRIIILE